jgi:LmbE family N-acetylglucosaminyl deacetylase
LILAHRNDEIYVTGYLAKAINDEHKRVAVLYLARGDTGNDAEAHVAEDALVAEREIEARLALAFFGITHVWFFGAPDTVSQNPLWTLEKWNHGAALEEAVRIIRLTRPEIIISTLPAYYTGLENRGDHQATGIIATEAFDMAGDPTKFPEQIAPPSKRSFGNWFGDVGIMNTEGLRPWQPEKMYYETNPEQVEILKGRGPAYSTTDVSPSLGVPYYVLAARSESYHLSQQGARVKEALARGKVERFKLPVQLVFGKSLVGGSVTGDVFEGVVDSIPFVPVRGYQPETHTGVWVELGDLFVFYRKFWPAHNLDRVANLLPVPQMGINTGGELPVPFLIQNDTNGPALVNLKVELPPGWIERAGSGRYPVKAHDVCLVQAILMAPSLGAGEWQEIAWHAQSAGQDIASGTIRVFLESRPGLPQ